MRRWTTLVTAGAGAALTLTACSSSAPLTQDTAPTKSDIWKAADAACEMAWSEPTLDQTELCRAAFMAAADAAIAASIEHGATAFDEDTEGICLNEVCLIELGTTQITEYGIPADDVVVGVQMPYVAGAQWVEDWIADGRSAA